MRKYILRRIASIIPVLLGISIFTFLIFDFVPGDPATMILREEAGHVSLQDLNEIRQELGLYDSISKRYINWLSNVLRFNFGKSYQSQRLVSREILSRFPATIRLAFSAIALALFFTFIMGILSAVYHNRIIDHLLRLWALLCVCTPGFLIALLLLHIFSSRLGLLPIAAYGSPKNMIMPALALSVRMSASNSRLLRAGMLEAMEQEYVKVARAKGLKGGKVIFGHAFKNAVLPIITTTGMSFASLLGGTMIIETVFSRPGIGSYCLSAITARDYPVVQCYVLIAAVSFVLVDLAVDLLYHFIDPRIELQSSSI